MMRVPGSISSEPSHIFHGVSISDEGFKPQTVERTVHLGGHNGASEDTTADGDHAGEGALLVNVRALDGRLGRAEAQTDVLVPSPVSRVLARSGDLVVQEDVGLFEVISIVKVLTSRWRGSQYLLLISALRLDSAAQLARIREVGSGSTYVSSVAMVAVGVDCR